MRDTAIRPAHDEQMSAEQRYRLSLQHQRQTPVRDTVVNILTTDFRTTNVTQLKSHSSPIRSAAMNASCGIDTLPYSRIRALPFFCFSSSFFLRVMSPP